MRSIGLAAAALVVVGGVASAGQVKAPAQLGQLFAVQLDGILAVQADPRDEMIARVIRAFRLISFR